MGLGSDLGLGLVSGVRAAEELLAQIKPVVAIDVGQ